ncbi:MAG: ribonuclease R [Candidatus Pseudoruminococcus sp.]|nr:ribonuclease R [Ruminococcus sp.]MDY2783359.1 ribonuclease R [Candidatus Pseudoruminococcus sp.]
MKLKTKDIVLTTLQKENREISRDELFKLSGISNKASYNLAISELQEDGDIILIKNKDVVLSEAMGYVKATILRSSRYFSFARPADGSPDIFIPCEKMKDAIPGDVVLLQDIRQEEKGPSAGIFRIVKKGDRLITGMVERYKSKLSVIADGGFGYSIPIVRGGELRSRDGDKVRAALMYDQHERKLYCRVLSIYGKANSAKICADAIIDRYGIPSEFSKGLRAEAKRVSEEPITAEEIAKRRDLRDEAILTIDSADAKDLDDAISVKKTENGWILGVHIADVSHYIREGSELDKEAFERGTSVYFADRVIPMLPEELSNGCCSLNSGTDKLTFSAIMNIDQKGNLCDFEFCKSIINSKVRGVYSEVNEILAGTADDELIKKYSPVAQTLKDGEELYAVLKQNAKERGELEIETTELKFVLNEAGVCIDVSTRTRGKSEEMIEQFMIMANQAAGKLAKEKNIPFVYRIHAKPEAERIATLSDLAQACGFRVNKIKPGLTQRDLAELLSAAKGTRYEKLMSMQVLRTMAKAQYDDKPIGHFGLSLADYCHFTSPIRRYPDTSIHRILSALVGGMSVEEIRRKYEDFAEESAKQSSEREVRAVNGERDTEKCYAAEYMTAHIGECYDGVVEGVTAKGIFVSIPCGIEGFVNLSRLENAFFEYNGTTTTTDKRSGISYSIGDSVRVKVTAATVALGTIDYELV